MNGVIKVGRKRKPDNEKSTTIFLRLPNPVLWEIEKMSDSDNVNELIVNIINEYLEKNRKKT